MFPERGASGWGQPCLFTSRNDSQISTNSVHTRLERVRRAEEASRPLSLWLSVTC